MHECPIVDEDGIVRCGCSTDDVLRLLADARRRRILALLEAEGGRIDVETVIATLAAMVDDRDVESWKAEFFHAHLPALEDGKLVDYDRRNGTIRYHRCGLVSDVLAAIETEEIAR